MDNAVGGHKPVQAKYFVSLERSLERINKKIWLRGVIHVAAWTKEQHLLSSQHLAPKHNMYTLQTLLFMSSNTQV